MTDIVLVEDHNGAYHLHLHPIDAIVVALTGEAVQALGEYHISFIPIVTTTQDVANAEENYMLNLKRVMEDVEETIPNFKDNYYNIQYTISAIAKRICLYSNIVSKFNPSSINIITPSKEHEFISAKQCNLLLKKTYGGDMVIITPENYTLSRIHNPVVIQTIVNIRYKLSKAVYNYSHAKKYAGLEEKRIAFVGHIGEDWECVIPSLSKSGAYIKRLNPPSMITGCTSRDLIQINMQLCGVDISDVISEVMKRYADNTKINSTIANEWFENNLRGKFDIACFASASGFIERQIISHCKKHFVPTIIYQHGFGYNFQVQPKDEIYELDCPDYFITYGEGNNQKRVGSKSKCIPSGSAKIQRDLEIGNPRSKGYALWISESTTHNTHVASLTEDVFRYYQQIRGLCILSESYPVIYRPLLSDVESNGVCRDVYLSSGIPNITIDAHTPLPILIANAEVIVIDTSSPTTWGESLVHNKPVVLFCNPLQTRIWDEVKSDLEEACCWCKTSNEFYDALKTIKTLKPQSRKRFVEKYIVPTEKSSIESVCQLLASVSRKKTLELPSGYAKAWIRSAEQCRETGGK